MTTKMDIPLAGKLIIGGLATLLAVTGIALATSGPTQRELSFIQLGQYKEQMAIAHSQANKHREGIKEQGEIYANAEKAYLNLSGELFQ